VEIITPVLCEPRARYELVFTERGPIAGLDAGAARHHAGTKGRAADRITGGAGVAARHVKGSRITATRRSVMCSRSRPVLPRLLCRARRIGRFPIVGDAPDVGWQRGVTLCAPRSPSS
jgi:hypothetical protein